MSSSGLKNEILLTSCSFTKSTENLVSLLYTSNYYLDSLILSHLPEGPTATFRVSGVKLRADIVNHGAPPSDVHPELIMNNFDTMLGHRIGRMLASMFPQMPNQRARRVITMHN